MSRPPSQSRDPFSDFVFRLAEDLGPDAVRDLLVHAPDDMPAAARARTDDAPVWGVFANVLDEAMGLTSPEFVREQLRVTIQIYEAYGGEDDHGSDHGSEHDHGSDRDHGSEHEREAVARSVCESEEISGVCLLPSLSTAT